MNYKHIAYVFFLSKSLILIVPWIGGGYAHVELGCTTQLKLGKGLRNLQLPRPLELRRRKPKIRKSRENIITFILLQGNCTFSEIQMGIVHTEFSSLFCLSEFHSLSVCIIFCLTVFSCSLILFLTRQKSTATCGL